MSVSTSQTIRTFSAPALSRLQSSLQGKTYLPGDVDYAIHRRVWNGNIDKHPSIIVRCASTQDVVLAVRFAREQGLEVAVRGGAHSTGGYSTSEGGMVIDLSPMKDIVVDPQKRTAVASAGLTLLEFAQATEKYGLNTTTGTVSDTGMSGLALGGGVGWLMSKYGLMCDNALMHEMVTADGEVVRANASENPELYWGLRGGGGNFGVVTTFEFQLHPVKMVLGGMILHPFPKAREVLRFYRDYADQTPDELTVYAALVSSPDGQPVVAIVPCYFGEDLSAGERILEPLRKFGPPIMDMIRPMPYTEMITLLDAGMPRGSNYYETAATLPHLTDEAVDLFIQAAASRTSPHCEIVIQHIHGAAGRVSPTATAFAARGNSYMPVFLGAWQDGPMEPHRDWSRGSRDLFKSVSVPAAYINFINSDDASRVSGAYGENYARLIALKRQYDPENFFHLNPNIKP